jgi:hypothetical protein
MAEKDTKSQAETSDVIWVLADGPTAKGDFEKYAGPLQIDAEKLGEHFQAFTGAISKALAKGETKLGRNRQFE